MPLMPQPVEWDERCWADDADIHGTAGCKHRAVTALGLCEDHHPQIVGDTVEIGGR